MPSNNVEWDWPTITGALLAFSLPLTLLVPDFSLWTVVPKVRVTRFHILAQHFTWFQLNTAVFTIVLLLFFVQLEIRKRKLDEMVERVMLVSQAADKTVEEESFKQAGAMRACVQLLDTSAEQYEQLVLLRQELGQRGRKQGPPGIDSSQDIND
ncbi:uncharacterized protein LOC125227617 [Leguminivora glycinivorella]|uniref:uncharacterized protein LOC125227617 n=1 Tax=Leguminivora glycinivorella TaxID=1035111 RepID=UPI00200BC47A|nr:uncharacterized protein LOC125227617 [Leguminivora glycinivorella]XP_047987931.1 uncharacterized protein LOC125227617 [Leguminivora glycinivorella]